MEKLYNVEIWLGKVHKATFYYNAPYAVCVFRKNRLMAEGHFERSIHIVQTKQKGATK